MGVFCVIGTYECLRPTSFASLTADLKTDLFMALVLLMVSFV